MSARRRLTMLLIACAVPMAAQSVQVGGPIAGLVYDSPTQSLRQIVGMPGGARLGAVVVPGVEWGSVAPNGQTALIQVGGDLRLVTKADLAEGGNGAIVGGVVESARLSAWASDSSSVAVYSSVSRAVQWIRVRDRSAIGDAPIAFEPVQGEVTAIAADGVSGIVAAAVSGRGVYRVRASDAPRLLYRMADASALAIEPGGQTLWVTDRASAGLFEITSLDAIPSVQMLMSDVQRMSTASALALSADRRLLYVADDSTRRLYFYDRAGAVLSDGVPLDAVATSLTPLGRPSVLLLGQRTVSTDPLYLLVSDGGDVPAVFFVPGGDGR